MSSFLDIFSFHHTYKDMVGLNLTDDDITFPDNRKTSVLVQTDPYSAPMYDQTMNWTSLCHMTPRYVVTMAMALSPWLMADRPIVQRRTI